MTSSYECHPCDECGAPIPCSVDGGRWLCDGCSEDERGFSDTDPAEPEWIYPSCPECLEIVLPEQPQGLPVGGRQTHEACYLRRFDREYLTPLRAMRRAI